MKEAVRVLKKLIAKEYALCKYFLEVKSKELLGYWSLTQIGDLNKIILAVIFSIFVAASTSATAWLLDPAIEKN